MSIKFIHFNVVEDFLVILYRPNKRQPNFYQCTASGEESEDGVLENLHCLDSLFGFGSMSLHRVCNANDGFLVILYSPNKRQPNFYQCTASGKGREDGALGFQLVGCR